MIPNIRSYGDYSSDNYGVNSLLFEFPNGDRVWYSYQTIIAFMTKGELVIRENDWSMVTGKHLNKINRDKKKRLNSEEFQKRLFVFLKTYNLKE